MLNITKQDLMFMAILLNIKEISIKHNIIIQIRTQNQQMLGNSKVKKKEEMVIKLQNGKKMFYIDKVKR